jgi:hypothetical protein
MLENNIYNIDMKFDYDTTKSIVLKSLEKIAKEETLKKQPRVPYYYGCANDNANNVNQTTTPTPLLKLKIRNMTKYLNWRIAVLKRDSFRCQICHTSVKDNKSLMGSSSR